MTRANVPKSSRTKGRGGRQSVGGVFSPPAPELQRTLVRSKIVDSPSRKCGSISPAFSTMVKLQFATVSIGSLCVAAFVIPSLLGKNQAVQHALCFSPYQVAGRLQLYRAVTSPFVHQGFFHILMNMFAWYFLNNDYESRMGSLSNLYNLFVIVMPLCAVVHLATAYTLDFVLGWHTTRTCAVGISGILFALLVISLEHLERVDVFGFFEMPAKWYPLSIAVVLQLLSPGLSFLGHLSGIAVGYAFLSERMSFVKPSSTTLTSVENRLSLRSLPHWVPSSFFAAFFSGANYGTSRGAQGREDNGSGISGTLGAARARINSLFSSDGDSAQGASGASGAPAAPPNVAVFQGTGHTVGGTRVGGSGRGTGVPPQSRLLNLPMSKKPAKPVAAVSGAVKTNRDTGGDAAADTGANGEEHGDEAV